MEYLITGKKEVEESDYEGGKTYVIWSPVVRGWYNAGENKFAYRYSWTDTMGGKHRLGKGWKRITSSEVDGGVKEWIRSLHEMEFEPVLGYDPLDECFVNVEWYRSASQLIDWEQQIMAQEDRISKSIEKLEWYPPRHAFHKITLNEEFPQHRHSCNYPVKCGFYEVCWEGTPIGVGGEFKFREPHHKMQKESLSGQGQ